MKGISWAVAVWAVCATLLSGCGASDPTASSKVQIVTSFYPLQYVADRVAGDHARVINLTNPGQEPHDLELSIAQTADVADADAVLLVGGLQPAVDAAVQESGSGAVFDVTEIVPMQGTDPHFWHDPLLMEQYADSVAQGLAELDPDNAGDYLANAEALAADLRSIDAQFTDGLADCERTVVVVSHDAFGYLTRYGLQFEPIVGLSPEAEPSPADFARLDQLIRDQGITTVFSETLVSPALSETLAAESGIVSATLDPLEGLTDDTSGADYLSLMRANLAALEKANGCH